MKSIAALGYLRYDLQQRAYFGTVKLAHLGDWVFESNYQGGRWLELARRVAELTHETGILAVENDIYAQYVHVILSGRPIAFNTQRSEEHKSELQSLMRISYAVFCLKKKTQKEIVYCKSTIYTMTH